jgi:holliday junction DNA helicase RuvA
VARVSALVIARLEGTLSEKNPGRLIVDVQGIGYDVQVPLSTFYVVGDPGMRVALRVHTHVREDVIALYGFATTLEQELFERLISISGIGPKLALAVLSGIEPPDLVRAIRAQDVARLTAIPGVGKKTAERIGLELKDRLPQSLQAAADQAKPASPEDQLRADLLSALLNLGYQRASAEKAIEKELASMAQPHFEAALRAVLRSLMKA